MKRTLAILLFASSFPALAQNNNIFYGGVGDGWSKASYAQAGNNIMFQGSAGDGWHAANYTQTSINTQFQGGAGDGWSANIYAQASVTTLFQGGVGDGWSTNNYAQASITTQFQGGVGDGWNALNYTQSYANLAFRGGAGDGWASTYTPMLPLPITFLNFDAVKKDKTSYLHWKLAKDDEVKSFDVERSPDAVNFVKVGAVAQQDARHKSYDFTDIQPMTGNNYYRLKIHNNNGTSEYTSTRVVKFEDAIMNSIRIYPNPATQVVNIDLPTTMTHSYKVLNIFGMNGAMVYQQKLEVNSATTITVNIEAFAAGSYMVHIISDNQSAYGKFIVASE